ncbi:Ankyrin repeat-containing protein [Cynara cardunculus var. scolymus]|uniref:Ankyrin repeat-containing protein n=1 Tax=Cynara cardunculus var. scolymus TaxID=59895 RepID=A0A118JZE7_CYNCS|nr:Ankyrin repeat-containing protein [Cynara cardunculus var. scolymus]
MLTAYSTQPQYKTTMNRLLYESVLKGDLITFLKLVRENETLITERVLESLNTVLHLAARFGHLELASEILRLCPEMVLAENVDLETPLHEACREGQVEMMKVLIAVDEGVVGKVNCRGESVFFVACERGRMEVVKHLIEFQWLLMHELDAFVCSIHVAAAAGHTATSQGYSPLHLACSKGQIDTIRELLDLDQDLSCLQDHNGWTPLHWASMKGRVGIIGEITSSSRESVDIVTSHGETVLHLAVKYNQFDALRYLMETLNVTELINVQDNDGNTVLHLATVAKLTTVVTYLLKRGVDVNAINRKGHTALDVVESDGSNSAALQIVPALLEHGAKTCHQLPRTSRDIQEHHFMITRSRKQHNNIDSPTQHYRRYKRKRSKQIELQNEGLRNARNTITVVAVLIATVTFSAGLNPPGGFHQDSGKATMGTKSPFKVFLVCNIMALFLSLGIVNVLVSVIPFRRKSMMRVLVATHKIMWVSTMFMASAFIAGIWTILPEGSGSRWVTIELMVIGVGCMLVVLSGLSVLLVKQWSRKQEWRRRNEKKKMKAGSPNGSVNSRVDELHFVKNYSRESSSNSDIDSSDHGYHVY